ncbi:MAG: hypothetical protein EOO73_06610 [Myxococcales bacterium]|nr:MAG: hypothetical protein EOO73_06610 [Myxococcales bacterium]
MKARTASLWVASLGALVLHGAVLHAEWGHGGLRETLGPPRAPYAMPGVDSRRSHHGAVTLAAAPRVSRRLRVAYGIGRGLVTQPDGGFLVLHPTPRASWFDAHGKLLSSLKLAAEPASAPVVTSSGRVAFVSGGALALVDERGSVRAETPLGDADFTARSILATRDGGVVVASSSWMVKLSASGDIVFRRSLPESPLDLLETSAGLFYVSALGSVLQLDSAGRLSKLGELGGVASASSVAADARLLQVRSGSHRLVSFDLVSRRVVSSVEDATLALDGPVLLGAERLAHAFSSDGLLVRYRADGSEAQRVPFDPGARKAPGSEDAVLLADERLLVARAGADVAIITPAGEVSTVPGSACPDPLGLLPAGPRAVLLACRSGNVLRLE